MKLTYLFETFCKSCQKEINTSNIKGVKPFGRIYCNKCFLKNQKKTRLKSQEENNKEDREGDYIANLFYVSQQMPDRGHDAERGTSGWIMGSPSPGRSF